MQFNFCIANAGIFEGRGFYYSGERYNSNENQFSIFYLDCENENSGKKSQQIQKEAARLGALVDTGVMHEFIPCP